MIGGGTQRFVPLVRGSMDYIIAVWGDFRKDRGGLKFENTIDKMLGNLCGMLN